MQIKLYRTEDAANVINKALTNQRVIDVALRRDFDLFSPDIVLNMASASEALAFNYVVIPDLGRRYLISNVENVGAKRWRYSLAVDVLETYRGDILESSHSYKQPLSAGDYGKVSLDTTGRVEVENVMGSVTLEAGEDSIVSLSTWSY